MRLSGYVESNDDHGNGRKSSGNFCRGRYYLVAPEGIEMTEYNFPPAVSDLVQKQLASGQFATEDEVLLAALQTLETESEDWLAVREALDSLEAGDRGMSLQDAFDQVRKRHSIAGQT